jgi:hypothetical protein
MASQPHPEVPGTFEFEFDKTHSLLLGRFIGRLTNDLLADGYRLSREYARATNARMAVCDLSLVTELAVSSDLVRQLAREEPTLPDAVRWPSIIVTPQTHAYGLSRMFQLMAGDTRPLLTIALSMDEALMKLGIQSTHFEPLRPRLDRAV